MTEVDYSSWLTKQQAADRIGVTTKSIERFVQAGKIQQARWRPSGRGPELAVYQPDDVARIAGERTRGPLPPFLVPVGVTVPTNGNGQHPDDRMPATVTALATVEPANDLLRALVAAVSHVMSETSQTSALFLTIPEAAAVSGLTQAYLRRLIDEQKLPAIRDRGWRIRRKDLEAL